MVAELLSQGVRLIARLLGLSTGLLSGRISAVLRRLAERHLRLAKEEAAEEAQRVLQGLALLFFAAVALACAVLMFNVVLMFAMRDVARLEWVQAALVTFGLDLLGAGALGGLAWLRLRAPWMLRTRRSLEETAIILRGE